MDFSNITSIICEFNPFHHGHKHLISKAKENHSMVICIMSGNFVQRGELAFADKYYRAKAALNCGADLVLSLPFPYSMMSARDFAFAGVHISESLNIPFLTFGAESDLEDICALADAFCTEQFEAFIAEKIKLSPNLSYAKARQLYAEKTFEKNLSNIIMLPNNILAVEYISAIKKNGYKIKPRPIKRDMSYMSSSSIRQQKDFLSFIPKESADMLSDAPLSDNDKFSSFAIATLRQKEIKKEYYEASGGLENRIINAATCCNTLEELYDKCVSSSFTRSKCRRAVMSVLFDIPCDISKKPTYTQLLGATEKGKEFLARCRKECSFNIITKIPLSYRDIDAEIKAENAIGIFYDPPLPHPLKRTPVIM